MAVTTSSFSLVAGVVCVWPGLTVGSVASPARTTGRAEKVLGMRVNSFLVYLKPQAADVGLPENANDNNYD